MGAVFPDPRTPDRLITLNKVLLSVEHQSQWVAASLPWDDLSFLRKGSVGVICWKWRQQELYKWLVVNDEGLEKYLREMGESDQKHLKNLPPTEGWLHSD